MEIHGQHDAGAAFVFGRSAEHRRAACCTCQTTGQGGSFMTTCRKKELLIKAAGRGQLPKNDPNTMPISDPQMTGAA